jgi:hypothetical protein
MTDAELRVACASLRPYATVIVRIYDQLKAEGQNWPDPDNRV